MDAEEASQVLQRLQVLEHAATEQLNARRGAERALVEAQTRVTQLDQVLQQGGRPGTAAGQETSGTAARRHGPTRVS